MSLSHTYYREPVFTLPHEDLAHIQRHVRCWDLLRNKRIFITGAAGFVGTWLVQSLEWADRCLHLNAQLTVIPRDSFPAQGFDYGIHAARGGNLLEDTNRTRRTLEFAAESGVSRLLFTSSGAVKQSLTEYARAKLAGERLCEQCGFDTVAARLFAFAGPALPLDANFAIGNFIRDVLAGGPITIQGTGRVLRSYLYAADMAIWLWTLLLRGERSVPYDVGSPEPIFIDDLARLVAANTIADTPIVTLGGEEAGVGSSYLPAVERAQTELGLRPLIPLAEGIRRMYAWNLDRKGGETAAAVSTIK